MNEGELGLINIHLFYRNVPDYKTYMKTGERGGLGCYIPIYDLLPYYLNLRIFNFY